MLTETLSAGFSSQPTLPASAQLHSLPAKAALGSGGGTEFSGGPRRLGAASFGRLGRERGRGADWAVQRGGGF